MSEGHSLLSASSAARWAVCPISVTGTKEDRTNRAAAEGTLGHSIAEAVLGGGAYPPVGSKHEVEGHEFEIDESFLADIAVYVDAVQSMPWEGGYHIESRVYYGQALSAPRSLAFGTADVWGFTVEDGRRVLNIGDLKMGRKAVPVDNNPQPMLYAAGVLESMDGLRLPRDFPVRLMIFQPRLARRPFVWMTTVGTIEDKMLELRPPAQAALEFSAKKPSLDTLMSFPEVPGGHCQYCRRQDECVRFLERARRIGQPGKVVQWDQTTFAMRTAIRDYLDELESYALDSANQGSVLPGTKLVRGRSGKAELATDEKEVLAFATQLGIADRVTWTEQVWATPAKIRDALRKAGASQVDISRFISQPEGSPVIADIDDPRPSILDAPGSGFSGVSR